MQINRLQQQVAEMSSKQQHLMTKSQERLRDQKIRELEHAVQVLMLTRQGKDR